MAEQDWEETPKRWRRAARATMLDTARTLDITADECDEVAAIFATHGRAERERVQRSLAREHRAEARALRAAARQLGDGHGDLAEVLKERDEARREVLRMVDDSDTDYRAKVVVRRHAAWRKDLPNG